jgi:hypothetical protein
LLRQIILGIWECQTQLLQPRVLYQNKVQEGSKQMTKEQFKAEADYQMAILLIKNLFAQGLLTDEEFKTVQGKLIVRYQPIIGNLSP